MDLKQKTDTQIKAELSEINLALKRLYGMRKRLTREYLRRNGVPVEDEYYSKLSFNEIKLLSGHLQNSPEVKDTILFVDQLLEKRSK